MTKLSECSGFSVASAGGSYTPPPWATFTDPSEAVTKTTPWPSGFTCQLWYYHNGCSFGGYKSNKFVNFAHITDSTSGKFKAIVNEVNPTTGAITTLGTGDVFHNTGNNGTTSGYSMYTFKNACVGTGYQNSPGQSGGGYERWGFTLDPATGAASNYVNERSAPSLATGPNEYPQAWNFQVCHTKPSGTTKLVFFSQDPSTAAGLWHKTIDIDQNGVVSLANAWQTHGSGSGGIQGFYHVQIANNPSWNNEAAGDFIQYMAAYRDVNTSQIHCAVSDSAGNFTVHNLGPASSQPSYMYGIRRDDGSVFLYNTYHDTWHHFTDHATVTTLTGFDKSIVPMSSAQGLNIISDNEIYLALTGNISHTNLSGNTAYGKLALSTSGFSIGTTHCQKGNTSLDLNQMYLYLGAVWPNSSSTTPSHMLMSTQQGATGALKWVSCPMPALIQ